MDPRVDLLAVAMKMLTEVVDDLVVTTCATCKHNNRTVGPFAPEMPGERWRQIEGWGVCEHPEVMPLLVTARALPLTASCALHEAKP